MTRAEVEAIAQDPGYTRLLRRRRLLIARMSEPRPGYDPEADAAGITPDEFARCLQGQSLRRLEPGALENEVREYLLAPARLDTTVYFLAETHSDAYVFEGDIFVSFFPLKSVDGRLTTTAGHLAPVLRHELHHIGVGSVMPGAHPIESGPQTAAGGHLAQARCAVRLAKRRTTSAPAGGSGVKRSVVSFVYTGKFRLHDRRGASGRSKSIPLACHQPKTSGFKTRDGNGESIEADRQPGQAGQYGHRVTRWRGAPGGAPRLIPLLPAQGQHQVKPLPVRRPADGRRPLGQARADRLPVSRSMTNVW